MADQKLKAIVDRVHELLQLLLDYQNASDGVDRPKLFAIDKSKTLDQFAMDATEVATYLSSIQKLFPMQVELTAIGQALASQGKIEVDYGDSYAEQALKHFKNSI